MSERGRKDEKAIDTCPGQGATLRAEPQIRDPGSRRRQRKPTAPALQRTTPQAARCALSGARDHSSLRAEGGAQRRPTAKQSRVAKRRLDCVVARAPRNDEPERLIVSIAF
jgi:hypothetical protein